MPIPNVAIIGRPNVGKSSIFNWLAGQRITIVDPTAGVTRDRVSRIVELSGHYVELVDTGGMGILDADGLTAQVEAQIARGIAVADLLLFVVDAHDPANALDRLVAERARQSGKPVLCVANKCDNPRYEALAQSEYHSFGFPLLLVSVTNHRNRAGLTDAILEHLPASAVETASEPELRLAIVGKTNVGKSTFINCLAQDERMIVSEIPGTTRDSVDVRFEHHGKAFVAIDTAGIRRKSRQQDPIVFYSQVRASETIRRADVVLLFFDPTTEIGRIEKQLAREVVDQYKPCVFVVNKWDLARPMPTGEFSEQLDRALPDLAYAPRAFITAKEGKNAQKLIDLAQGLFRQSRARVTTARLNRVIAQATEKYPPPNRQGRQAKIYYAAQAATAPPTLVLFCNDPRLLTANYRRYLTNYFRDRLPFGEVPIRLLFRRREAGQRQDSDAEPKNARGAPRRPPRKASKRADGSGT